MSTNDRVRRHFAGRIGPDTRIESVVALQKVKRGPSKRGQGVLREYTQRFGITNALAPQRHPNHWCVVTEHRVLLFAKPSRIIGSARGPLEHELHRVDVSLRWADFVEGPGLRYRLVHLTTGDMRMLVAQTFVGIEAGEITVSDEANLMVRAFGERAKQVDLVDLG